MRIISGIYKGTTINVNPKLPVRPTTNFAKEGLFNTLKNHFEYNGSKILDLCCGTGNISFEFASQKVEDILSIDYHFGCVRFVYDTAKSLNIKNIRTYYSDALKFVKKTNEYFDLIFADPPYISSIYDDLLFEIFDRNLLLNNGILILEHNKNNSFITHPYFFLHKKYGYVHFTFFKKI